MSYVLSGSEASANASEGKSIHHDFIKSVIPDWFTQSSVQRIRDLKSSSRVIPEWSKAASAHEHNVLKRATEAGWRSQNDVDRMLGKLQDVHSFAQPLLSQALKEKFGVDEDVREIYLKLYSPAKSSPWKFNVTEGVSTRTVSLLEAALHNFSQDEVFLADSRFISKPDARGQFEFKKFNNITVEQFKALCRTLDIGARYKDYLESYLLPEDGLVQGVLQHTIIESQKSALKAAAHLALMKKDIGADGYLIVLGMLRGAKGLKRAGIPVRFYHLTVLDTQLTGIVLIAPDLDAPNAGTQRVIAYVPHDPEHPLKEYASSTAFALELTRQLRDTARQSSPSRLGYQQFFSRFVNHDQRGHFFAALNARLVEIRYHGQESGTNLPAWRETPVENPRLEFDAMPFESDVEDRFNGNLWAYLYEQQLNKILNDGRALAISTAAADSAARWAWVEDLEKMLADIMNVALLVVTPFVPMLGEVMLAYMAYQLVSEVVEGVVDLAEGLYGEAADHLIDFTESLIQAGLFVVGGSIVKGVVPPRLSSFIEGAKPVRLANGGQRLWGQDLEPYRQKNLRLAADSKPDDFGLHQHQGKQILRLGTHHFELKKDPRSGQHRVQHPIRPDAYQPEVQSNGAGAFVIEGEKPHTWDADTLMRRLGPSVEGLSDVLEDIRIVSRTDTGALLRMYSDNERALPLLSDTVTRFRIDREIQTFIEGIGSVRPQDYLKADLVLQFQLLDGLWPGKAIELTGADGQVLGVIGRAGPTPVRVYPDRLIDGDLIKTLLSHLDEAEIKRLLNDEFGAPVLNPQVNASRLRAELARLAGNRKTTLFDNRYRSIERAVTAEARVIQGKVEDLPGPVAQELVSLATPAELQALKLKQLPERLENLGRCALRDVRVSRAYEGFYLESVDNPDTNALALHSLENLPGWNADVRIDIHQYRYGGRQLDSIGTEDATIRRTVVAGEDGVFQSFDDQGNALHSGSDFYTSILQALPDAERNGLNIHIGEGLKLKAALRDHALKPYRLLKVLSDLPVLKSPTYDPSVMRLRGGAPTSTGEAAQLQIMADIYPELVAVAFHPSIPSFERYNYLRGLKLMHETLSEDCFYALWEGLNKANAVGAQANLQALQSIEVLPDLQTLMLPEQFGSLIDRLFTENGLVPLTETERNLGSNARNLEQTGRQDEYQALQRAVRENPAQSSEALIELHSYADVLSSDVLANREPTEVTPQVMANLQQAQRAIYRSKELLPLSGNQLASIWENGGSAIAKIKGLRELNLEEGGFTARLTVAEAARKAIDIKGGNCSENSKVTFSILASQPRASRVHIVKATAFDHQYVVIGDDLDTPGQLVVADSWPEFPAAHTVDNGYFQFDLPPLATLEPGLPVADYAFINDAPPGRATLPEVSESNTYRQIKMNKLYKSGAYAQFTSLKVLGTTYNLPGEVPVSFERMPASVVDRRIEAYDRYCEAFKDLLTETTE